MSPIISPVVTLPRMDAAEAITLVLSLKTALHHAQTAQEKPAEEPTSPAKTRRGGAEPASAPVVIPGNVASCMTRLDACCATLTLARSHGVTTKVDVRSRSAARQSVVGRYKKAWTAVRSQVAVWRETGAVGRLTPAQRDALDVVFPADGDARNLKSATRRVWADGRDTLAEIKSRGVDAAFSALGGDDALAHVRALHTQLGAELGVTARAKPSVASGGAVADALGAIRTTLREYVIKVHAMIDPAVPASAAAVGALLSPIDEVFKRSRATVAKSTATKAPAKPPVVDPNAKPSNTDAQHPPLRPTGTG